ncbi:MAG: class I SAM-dependent methyltransferase [Burkholderiales bacterium]|nr:class I SAM-dependent methyltransferase [Burkholderiales bacterium]
MTSPDPVEFFEQQFLRQIRETDFALNPFEKLALPYLAGSVLDLGCGLGNLSLEAARRGCMVTALDASPTAVERLRAAARQEQLRLQPLQADLGNFRIEQDYDTIVAIGLLMFLEKERALTLLSQIVQRVRPSGCAIVNVLVEGTTYLEMFKPGEYYLFGANELEQAFAGWTLLAARRESFPAPEDTRKEFATVVAQKPPG